MDTHCEAARAESLCNPFLNRVLLDVRHALATMVDATWCKHRTIVLRRSYDDPLSWDILAEETFVSCTVLEAHEVGLWSKKILDAIEGRLRVEGLGEEDDEIRNAVGLGERSGVVDRLLSILLKHYAIPVDRLYEACVRVDQRHFVREAETATVD